ncbi:MAG: DNA repair protein RadC [Deltaproteobacteria bacterium]|nr:DNA repair protein RadC [Deltaproteobacteria bacterium]
MHYHGHRDRLRERLDKNPCDLADYEILELLLGQVLTRRDTKPLAKDLLARFHSLRGVLDARPAELLQAPGFGPGLLNYWLLLRETLARYAEAPLRRHEVLATPESVAAMARLRLAGLPYEKVWAAFVDNQNRLIAWECVSAGSVESSAVYPREIMEKALLKKASGFFLVHNHPGGRPTASQSDLDVTRRVLECAKIMEIRMLDHLIVSDQGWSSIMHQGLV